MHEGVRHHVAATLGEPDDLPARAARARRRTPHAARRRGAARRPLRPARRRRGRRGAARAPPTCRPRWRASPSCSPTARHGRRPHLRPRRRRRAGEQRDLRGLHPMMAERMDMWRLREFALERLPSAPDVYLFRADGAREPARRAPRRRRRGARPDAGARRGRPIVALPELERIVRQAFEAMRSFQSRRRPRERLLWNRLLLYAWPEMDFAPRRGARRHRALRAHVRRARAGDGAAAGLREAARRPRPALLQPGRPRRRGRGRRPADAPAAAARRGRPADRLRPPPRDAASGRDREDPRAAAAARRAIPPASSSSTTSTTTAGSSRSTARPPPTRRASWSALIRNRTERHPEGMLRVVAARRPDARRSARSPSPSAGA